MLTRATNRSSQTGVSLVELMIGLAIFSTLLAVVSPSISSWIRNSQIRTAAEGVLNGLQVARATAVQRNTVVNFYFTTTLTGSCALSTSGPDWVVSLDSPAGNCAAAYSDTVAPRIVQTRSGRSGNATVVSEQSTIGFNGLGRRVNAGTAASVAIDFSNTSGSATCAADGGSMRCLRVIVSASGQVRLCDPAAAASDTRSCT